MNTYPFSRIWFLPIIISTIIIGTMYVLVQQVVREGANDPQITMAEDTAFFLENGRSPSDFDLSFKIDIVRSLTPYILIYDEKGNPVSSTGQLNGSIPQLPEGVFSYALSKGQNRITWQPQSNVRSALVVVPYSHGFVAVGKSLREIEIRENALLKIAVMGWALVLLLIFLYTAYSTKQDRKIHNV